MKKQIMSLVSRIRNHFARPHKSQLTFGERSKRINPLGSWFGYTVVLVEYTTGEARLVAYHERRETMWYTSPTLSHLKRAIERLLQSKRFDEKNLGLALTWAMTSPAMEKFRPDWLTEVVPDPQYLIKKCAAPTLFLN